MLKGMAHTLWKQCGMAGIRVHSSDGHHRFPAESATRGHAMFALMHILQWPNAPEYLKRTKRCVVLPVVSSRS